MPILRRFGRLARILVLSALFCAMLATTSFALKVTATATLNVRKSPSTSSKILTKMPEGTRRTVRGKSNDGQWYKIIMNGKTGYISKQYTTSADSVSSSSYYDLQTNYAGVAYTNKSGKPAGATIYSSGCCPVALGNILRNKCGISGATTRAVCSLATYSGARMSTGTQASNLLAACKDKWGGFSYRYTSSDSEMRSFVANGGMALAHTNGSSNGLFSTDGHFVAIISVGSSRLKVADPYYYSGKWTANSNRRANITTTSTKGVVYANTSAVYSACNYYYLIK